MLRIEEREGPTQSAEVFLLDDGLIPFTICLSPFRRHTGEAPWYWRPDNGDQVFEIQVSGHNGPLAAFTCVSIREGLRVLPRESDPLPNVRTARGTVCVVSDNPWFTPRETADPDPVPTPSHFPVILKEPIGVTVEVFADAIRAHWPNGLAVAEAIELSGGVALLMDDSAALVGVEIRKIPPRHLSQFTRAIARRYLSA